MSKKERLVGRCELCLYHGDCGFLSRNMRDRCPELSEFEDGYDYAIADAVAWLKEHANEPLENLEKAIYGKD